MDIYLEKYQAHPLFESDLRIGVLLLEKAFASVSAKERFVEILHLHPYDLNHLRSTTDLVEDKDDGNPTLWGAEIWDDEEEPGYAFVQGYPCLDTGIIWEAHMKFLPAEG